MAKLYFRYAVMNAGKTIQLLQIANDYEVQNNLRIAVIKPEIDTKEDDCVISRVLDGLLKRKCDFLIKPDEDWLFETIKSMGHYDIILIDEAQFLSKANVWDLAKVVAKLDIPVICFGLKSDFRGEPFEGSSYLFALAQDVEEVTTRAICQMNSKPTRATMNLRMVDGKPSFEGDQVSIDGECDVTYLPVSLKTFIELKEKAEK